MTKVVKQIRANHATVFALAEKINVYGHQMLFESEVRTQDIQQVLVACLLQRALTSYQGVILLCERGMPSEAKVILRTLLEVVFRLIAISKDIEVGRTYILEDEVRRRKLINKFKNLSPQLRSEIGDPDLQRLLDSILQNISVRDIQEHSILWYAKRAALEDMYHTAYSYFSASVHVSVRDLVESSIRDDNGAVKDFRYGPSDAGLNEILLTAMEVAVLSLKGAFSVLPLSSHEALDSVHGEVIKLFAELLQPEA